MEEIKNLVNEFKENKTKLESLNKSYEDIKQLGEDTGIAQVLRTNIEKAQKEYDKVKTKMDNKFEELTTKKENLTLEISELEEKKEKVQKEIDFFDNLIKRDKENNVKNSDKIQQARIEKAGNLKDEILDIEDVIYTKNNELDEINNALEEFNIEEYIKNDKEELEEVEKAEVVEQEKQEYKAEANKDNNIEENDKLKKDDLKILGDKIILDIARDYKNARLNVEPLDVKVPKIEINKTEEPKKVDNEVKNIGKDNNILENISKDYKHTHLNTNEDNFAIPNLKEDKVVKNTLKTNNTLDNNNNNNNINNNNNTKKVENLRKINISESNNSLICEYENGYIQKSLDKIMENKKLIFEKNNIKKICKEICKEDNEDDIIFVKLEQIYLMRKLNPAVIYALNGDEKQIRNYIESIFSLKQFNFDLTHSLSGLSPIKKILLRKYTKDEEKCGGTILGKIFDKNKTLQTAPIGAKIKGSYAEKDYNKLKQYVLEDREKYRVDPNTLKQKETSQEIEEREH